MACRCSWRSFALSEFHNRLRAFGLSPVARAYLLINLAVFSFIARPSWAVRHSCQIFLMDSKTLHQFGCTGKLWVFFWARFRGVGARWQRARTVKETGCLRSLGPQEAIDQDPDALGQRLPHFPLTVGNARTRQDVIEQEPPLPENRAFPSRILAKPFSKCDLFVIYCQNARVNPSRGISEIREKTLNKTESA